VPTLLLAVFAILLTVRVEAGQSGSDKQPNLRLEVVTFPQDVQVGFKDLNKQALLYHPIEKPEGKTPLIILLHGAGGTKKQDISSFKRNRDVKWVLKPANSKRVAKILVPQSRGLWDPDSLNKMLDHILSTNSDIDKDRVYCIGYSMGGKGTWEWAMSSPKRFAAIIPVAFIADLSKLEDMVDLSIWAMVGTRDRRRAQGILEMEKALKELGSTVVRTTIFKGANHASTPGKAWAQEGLLDWLLAQSRLRMPT
jgi:predicted peptidase